MSVTWSTTVNEVVWTFETIITSGGGGGGGGGSGTVDHVSNVATGTILGRATAGTGNSEELTASQARTVMGLGTAATTPASDYLQAGSGFNTADGWLKLDGDGTVPDNRIPASIARGSEVTSAASAAQAAAIAASQPLDSDLTAIAALATQAHGRSLLTATDHAALMTLLALVAADIPSLDASKIGSGDIAAARLGLAPHAGLYGTGADGDVTISGATTVVSDSTAGFKHYRNLTIGSGQTLTASGLIFCSGTLTRTGTISAPGGDGAGSTGGASGLGIHASGSGTAAGGNGGWNAGVGGFPTSNPGTGTVWAGGGRGGTGGTGVSAGGVAGLLATLTNVTDLGMRTNLLHILQGWVLGRSQPLQWCGAGTGGGGGGGNGALQGGGGGGGGGMLVIVARHIVGTGAITAPGGNGATMTGGDLGGGGGGGGGLVCVVSGDTTVDTTNISAPGGTGASGTGTGTAGATGSAGNVITYLGVS